VVPPSYYWGRAPTLFWTTVIATAMNLGIALTDDLAAFYVLRALQGGFITTCNVMVLTYIKDIFYYHEHARKIGIWFLLYFTAPSLGPLCGSFIVAYTPGWRGPFWMSLAYNSVCICLILAFVDETYYRRDIAVKNQPARGSRIFRLLGSWQIKHHRQYFLEVLPAYKRILVVGSKPVILIAVFY
jgi:MFS family permease